MIVFVVNNKVGSVTRAFNLQVEQNLTPMDALKRWRFQPGTKSGKPVKTYAASDGIQNGKDVISMKYKTNRIQGLLISTILFLFTGNCLVSDESINHFGNLRDFKKNC